MTSESLREKSGQTATDGEEEKSRIHITVKDLEHSQFGQALEEEKEKLKEEEEAQWREKIQNLEEQRLRIEREREEVFL